jgi:hypothetical protein
MPDEPRDESRRQPIYDQPPDRSEVWEGLLFALGATIVFVAAVLAIASVSPALNGIAAEALFACGVSQLIYIVPLVVALRHFDRFKAAKGVIIFAALVFLLNATCWGIVMSLRRR